MRLNTHMRHGRRLVGGSADRETFIGGAVALLHKAAGGLGDRDRLAAAQRDACRKKTLVERGVMMRVVEADR